MSNILYSIYKRIKTIPIVGPLALAMRNIVRSPARARARLQMEDAETASRVISELFPDQPNALEYLENFRKSEVFSTSYGHGYSGDFDVMFLHTLTRILKPEVVVETGVASGRSSSAILQAISENKKGTLHSVDLPHFYEGDAPTFKETTEGNMELQGYVPKGKEPGWLIPESLRVNWRLILGDSKVELPKLVPTLPQIDIFYHDGEHNYETMTKEFALVWEKIPVGGFLLADDIDWNTAWSEFCATHKGSYQYSYRHFGIIRK